MTTESLSPTALSVKKSLNISWKEGIFANVMLVTLEYYAIPFAIFLGASPFEIGMLVALPQLLGSASQLLAVKFVRFIGSRIKFLIYGCVAQALVVIPMAALALLTCQLKIQILLLCMILYRVLGNLIATAWGSLMSDYLLPNERGKYLGRRSQIVGISGIVTMIMAGLTLFIFKRYVSPSMGFCILFVVSALCRLISSFMFIKMVDTPHETALNKDFTFLMFLRQFKRSNFVKYVLYVSSITFATQISSAYFSVHMLQNLHFSYLAYMSIHLAAVLSGLIAFPIWGKHANQIGNAKVLKLTSWFIPFIPLFWIFSGNMYYLILVELFSGFIWGGFNLCATNFIFDAVRPNKRVRCLAYFNLLNGLAIFLGAFLGGILAEKLPVLLGHRLNTLFLLSAVLRFAAHFFLSGKFQEVRLGVTKVRSYDLFFSVLGLRSMAGRNRDWHIIANLKSLRD